MKTLYVFCEGRTEQQFCKQVLAPHLASFGFLHLPPIRVAFSRSKGVVQRGGIRSYKPMRDDIVNTITDRTDNDVYFTTMLDLYGLPRGFPGKSESVRNPSNPYPHVRALESAFGKDIGHRHFVPYLQLHEYETMLFADPEAFAISFDDSQRAIAAFQAIVAKFGNIEFINDGRSTAPSKRIIRELPAYEGLKVSAGPDIAEFIGLPELREEVRTFRCLDRDIGKTVTGSRSR